MRCRCVIDIDYRNLPASALAATGPVLDSGQETTSSLFFPLDRCLPSGIGWRSRGGRIGSSLRRGSADRPLCRSAHRRLRSQLRYRERRGARLRIVQHGLCGSGLLRQPAGLRLPISSGVGATPYSDTLPTPLRRQLAVRNRTVRRLARSRRPGCRPPAAWIRVCKRRVRSAAAESNRRDARE